MGCLHLTCLCTVYTQRKREWEWERDVIKLSSWPIVGNLAFFFARTPFFSSLFPSLGPGIVLSLCNMQDSIFFPYGCVKKGSSIWSLVTCQQSMVYVCVCMCVTGHRRNTTWNSFKRLIDIDAPIGWRTPNYVIGPRFNENRNWFSPTLSRSLHAFFLAIVPFLLPSSVLFGIRIFSLNFSFSSVDFPCTRSNR